MIFSALKSVKSEKISLIIIFCKKLLVPPLVDPRAVEIDIVADLKISKKTSKRGKNLHVQANEASSKSNP
jgi:hypothetical protein